jgi:hypothetical protein
VGNSAWPPEELLELRERALRGLTKLNVPQTDAEILADRIQDAMAERPRAEILFPKAFLSRAVARAAQNWHARGARRQPGFDLESVPAGALLSKPQQKLARAQRKLDEREANERALSKALLAIASSAGGEPDFLDEEIGWLAHRFQDERPTNTRKAQDRIWTLAALARDDTATLRAFGATARKSFPRRRFSEMRETEKPPFARSTEELARLLADKYVSNQRGASVQAIAQRLTLLAITVWPRAPITNQTVDDLRLAAQEAISVAEPDRRARDAQAKKASKVRAVVRNVMRRWGFRGVNNLLKRL